MYGLNKVSLGRDCKLHMALAVIGDALSLAPSGELAYARESDLHELF